MKLIAFLLFLALLFMGTYVGISLAVNRIMAELKVEPEPVYIQTLQVRPNYGSQTDQYKPLQPAVTPIGKEL